ncbi:esterase family protein [Mollisia scopiformis]|uniref:Esterase family protein n=1 Tax=Mollisia scopiformis TaxID=149040 RepID=A0A194X694_MOLSC|nr:esterase family protein [Mollisia scopiformis]KUJ15589.1 esterase family protein [Mollisia scopiformis]
MKLLVALFLFASPLLTSPTVVSDEESYLQKRAPSFEWTSWGDSYASGVGSGNYINGRRCLRYDAAYPMWIQDDPSDLLPGTGGKLNNVVCSGAKAQEIEEYQFYTEDQASGQPNWTYYPRPGSGKPTMGTLTVGGDDIDFPRILNNCIIEGFPWPLSLGFVSRTCDEQRALSWSLICQNGNHDTPNDVLVSKIDSLIKKIVQYGRSVSGNNFRLYVTGYGQFFNDADPGCNTVTFARTANPVPDGKPHILMSTVLRQDFNLMSITLNAAIQSAVSQNSESNVKYIDIDASLGTGHRFCEPGVNEPDQDNPSLWFWHYPYGQKDESTNPTIHLTWSQNSTLWTDYLNDFWSKVDEDQLLKTVNSTMDNVTVDDTGVNSVPPSTTATILAPTSSVSPTPAPAYATGTCCFHLDEWEDCDPDTDDLYANITLVDNNKRVIYQTPPQYFTNNGLGDPINNGNGTTIQGPLPSSIAITGEHQNDYIQLVYGVLSWTSRTTSGTASCKVGGWNPRDGPFCGNDLGLVAQPAENQMDCCFPC